MRTRLITLIAFIAILLAGNTEAVAARMSKAARADYEACLRAEFILESLGVTEADYVSQAPDQNDLEKRLQSMGWVAQPDPFSRTTTYTKTRSAATITIHDLLAGQEIPQLDKIDQRDLQNALSRGTPWTTPTAKRRLTDARFDRQMSPQVLFGDMRPGNWVQFRKAGESKLTVGRFLGVTDQGMIQYEDYSQKAPATGSTPQTITPDQITRGSVDAFNYSSDARKMHPDVFKQVDREIDLAMQDAKPGTFIRFLQPGRDKVEVGKIIRKSKSPGHGRFLDFYWLGSSGWSGRATFEMSENVDPHSIRIYPSEDAFREANPNFNPRLDAFNQERQDEENKKVQQKERSKQSLKNLKEQKRAKKQKVTNQLEVLYKQQGKYLRGGEKVALADILSIKFKRYFKDQPGRDNPALLRELMFEMVPKEYQNFDRNQQWPELTMKWVYKQYPELEELKLPNDPLQIDSWLDQLERKIGGQLMLYPNARNNPAENSD